MAKSYSTFSDMAASNFASISGPTKSTKTSGPDDGLRGGTSTPSKSSASKGNGIMSYSGGGDSDSTPTKQRVAQQQGPAVGLGVYIAEQGSTKSSGDEKGVLQSWYDWAFGADEDDSPIITPEAEPDEVVNEVLNEKDFPLDPRTNLPVGALPRQRYFTSTDPLDLASLEGSTQGFNPPAVATGLEVVQAMDVDAKAARTRRSIDEAEDITREPISSLLPSTTIEDLNLLNSEVEADRVKGVQARLSHFGYNTRGVDGVMGNNTRRAIREFQQNNELTVTGEIDEATLNALRSTEPDAYEYSRVIDVALPAIGDIETTEAHLGAADYTSSGITLAYGIVPEDGLKYQMPDGTVIDLGKKEDVWSNLSAAGVTLQSFNPDNVITDDATKSGVRRGDYATDLEWTNAVLRSFEIDMEAAIKEDGVEPTDIRPEARAGILSFGWNLGPQAYSYNMMAPAYTELAKEEPNFNVVGSGMLQVFTSEGNVIRGLANRRALDYNIVAEAYNNPTIVSYTPIRLSNGNAGFRYTYSDGTQRTIDTNRNYATHASQASFKNYLNQTTAIVQE